MPEDLYDDGGETAGTLRGARSTPEQSKQSTSEESGYPQDKGQGKPALINSEICPGLDVGDSLVLKVTGVKDGEYVVEYESEPEDESGPGDDRGGPHMGPPPGPEGYE